MIKNVNFKICTTTQMKCLHGKLPFCPKNRRSRDLHSFRFAVKLFHKTLPLKFDKFIPYFQVFTSGTKMETLPISDCRMVFNTCAFRMKTGLRLFLKLFLSVSKNCKYLPWIFNLLPQAKRSSYEALLLFYIILYHSFACLFLSKTSKSL